MSSKALVLRLEGPLQAWGDQSRGKERGTASVPTASGITGLLGAALGIPRGGDFSDLRKLSMSVRVDKPGRIYVDFQSMKYRNSNNAVSEAWQLQNPDAKHLEWNRSENRIFHKEYLTDASFLVVLEGDESIVDRCAQALKEPVYPLFLGRRNCPPSTRILYGVYNESAEEILKTIEFPEVESCRVVRSARPQETGHLSQDILVSNQSTRRLFGSRQVVEEQLANPSTVTHEPFSMLPTIEGTSR